MHPYPESRECTVCKFTRVPGVRYVTKNRKHWVIYTCLLCGARDLDAYYPKRLLNGLTGRFEDEVLPNESDSSFEDDTY